MMYNLRNIGNRLREERKAAGFKSQEKLCDYIRDNNHRSFKRQTIAKWENGDELPPLDVLCTLCVPFQCEVGYLLCEYNCKTRVNTDIQKETGLSEKSIENLRRLSKSIYDKKIDALNCILEDEDQPFTFLSNLSLYVNNQYDTPLYYDPERGYVDASYQTANGEKGITFGYPVIDNRGNPGYNSIGVGTNLLESYAMLQVQETMMKWKEKYKKENASQKV